MLIVLFLDSLSVRDILLALYYGGRGLSAPLQLPNTHTHTFLSSINPLLSFPFFKMKSALIVLLCKLCAHLNLALGHRVGGKLGLSPFTQVESKR